MSDSPSPSYLDRLMRRESFGVLWPLFARATKPAKELSESFSALVHLRPLLRCVGPSRVLHVGDGAHARTAALFAVKTKTDNISIDPVINEPIVQGWRDEFAIERFAWRKSRIDREAAELNALSAATGVRDVRSCAREHRSRAGRWTPIGPAWE